MQIKVIRNRKRKRNISLEISGPDLVIVRAPVRARSSDIQQVIEQHQDWINDHLQRFQNRELQLGIKGGVWQLPYLGKLYPLHMNYYADKKRDQIDFRDGAFTYHTYGSPQDIDDEQIKKTILKWYKKELEEIVSHRTKEIADQLNTDVKNIRIRKARSVWGSCSSEGNLSFNVALMMVPIEMIEYVVIHEVCHRIHPHHQKSFWRCVERFDPEFQTHRRWLKTHSYLATSLM